MVVGVYRDWPESSALNLYISNFHFHYGSNLTSSGIQVPAILDHTCLGKSALKKQKTLYKVLAPSIITSI